MGEKFHELGEELEALKLENEALKSKNAALERENAELRRENARLKEHHEADTCENDNPNAGEEEEAIVDLIMRRAEIIRRLNELAEELLNHTCQNELEVFSEILASWKNDEIAKPMPTKILNSLLTSKQLSESCLNAVFDAIITAVNTAPIKVGGGRKLDPRYADLIKKLVLNEINVAKAERLLKIYCEQFCKKTKDGSYKVTKAEGLFDVAMKSEKFTIESGDGNCFQVRMK